MPRDTWSRSGRLGGVLLAIFVVFWMVFRACCYDPVVTLGFWCCPRSFSLSLFRFEWARGGGNFLSPLMGVPLVDSYGSIDMRR